MMPSAGIQYKAHQQGRVQGLSLIRITPIIWIKILKASWPTAFNHFDVPLKRTSLFSRVCVTRAASVRAFLPPLSLSGSDRCGTLVKYSWGRITYRRRRAFPSPCSFPGSSRPHTRTCRRPPAGNTESPGLRWLSSCPPSWGTERRPLSSS